MMNVNELMRLLSELPADANVEISMLQQGTGIMMKSDARTVKLARDGTVFVTTIEEGQIDIYGPNSTNPPS